jgi:hypothetical protein
MRKHGRAQARLHAMTARSQRQARHADKAGTHVQPVTKRRCGLTNITAMYQSVGQACITVNGQVEVPAGGRRNPQWLTLLSTERQKRSFSVWPLVDQHIQQHCHGLIMASRPSAATTATGTDFAALRDPSP